MEAASDDESNPFRDAHAAHFPPVGQHRLHGELRGGFESDGRARGHGRVAGAARAGKHGAVGDERNQTGRQQESANWGAGRAVTAIKLGVRRLNTIV